MEQERDLKRLLDLSIKIKQINEEIRIEIDQRIAELTMLLKGKDCIN